MIKRWKSGKKKNKIEYMPQTIDGEKLEEQIDHLTQISPLLLQELLTKERVSLRRTKQAHLTSERCVDKVCRVGIQWLVSYGKVCPKLFMFQWDCIMGSQCLESTQPGRWRFTSTCSHCHMWKTAPQPGPYVPPCLFNEFIYLVQLYLILCCAVLSRSVVSDSLQPHQL